VVKAGWAVGRHHRQFVGVAFFCWIV